ncbi:hypothetical protein L1049_018162 [Liquidambar formosana]|uniref:Peptidase M1 membrane alanine aminopeptidase domain-containing protein n=1 Tax=Liquidambar formosana TaxID=63359 RepID=A0AAP0NIR9_LIQFO
MEWWTHLWLNEGFATWVSYLATDNLFPEWKIWTQFLVESNEGLRLDGLAGSHPIEVEINHTDEINEIFDAISYTKGASLIRMLQSYLGPECFQRSLASYIKRFACSNTKTEDLWVALEEESREPVNKLMNSWTKQKGYPVVSVKVKDQILEFDQFSSFEKANEVEEFFASRTTPSIARTLKQSIERVHINAKWVQSIQSEKHLAEAVKELAYRKY